jgi:hypothetical protein
MIKATSINTSNKRAMIYAFIFYMQKSSLLLLEGYDDRAQAKNIEATQQHRQSNEYERVL